MLGDECAAEVEHCMPGHIVCSKAVKLCVYPQTELGAMQVSLFSHVMPAENLPICPSAAPQHCDWKAARLARGMRRSCCLVSHRLVCATALRAPCV